MALGETSVLLVLGQPANLTVTKKTGEAPECVIDFYEGLLCLLEGPVNSSYHLDVRRTVKAGVHPRRVRPTFLLHFRTIVEHSPRCPLSRSGAAKLLKDEPVIIGGGVEMTSKDINLCSDESPVNDIGDVDKETEVNATEVELLREGIEEVEAIKEDDEQ